MEMRKLAVILVILAMASTAGAAVDWEGDNNGLGDGWDFNNGLNWDDHVNPEGNGWNIHRRDWGYYIPFKAWDIQVTSNISTGGGSIYERTGYPIDFTVNSGVTFVSTTLTFESAGTLTVESGAFYDMRYGNLNLENGNLTVTIDADGHLYCSTLRHNNGAMVDVHGLLEAWQVSRISAEGTYRLNVYGGGEFVVRSGVPADGWAEGGKVTQFVNSTVTLYGDFRTDYLTKIQAGEAGSWQVEYDGAWTTIQLFPLCWDQDDDGDVDMTDFAVLQGCLTSGAPGGGLTSGCECYDVRSSGGVTGSDGEIDAWDLAAFVECASGAGVPAAAGCVD